MEIRCPPNAIGNFFKCFTISKTYDSTSICTYSSQNENNVIGFLNSCPNGRNSVWNKCHEYHTYHIKIG